MHADRIEALMKTTAVVLGLLLTVFSEARREPHPDKPVVRIKSGLVGVWKPTAVWSGSARAGGYAKADIRVAGPGLRIFTERYYSLVQQPDSAPRPRLSAEGSNSAEDFRAAWGPFGANAGPYVLVGDTIIARPVIAKNSQDMRGAFEAKSTYRVVADTLWIIAHGVTPRSAGDMMRYVRIE